MIGRKSEQYHIYEPYFFHFLLKIVNNSDSFIPYNDHVGQNGIIMHKI